MSVRGRWAVIDNGSFFVALLDLQLARMKRPDKKTSEWHSAKRKDCMEISHICIYIDEDLDSDEHHESAFMK